MTLMWIIKLYIFTVIFTALCIFNAIYILNTTATDLGYNFPKERAWDTIGRLCLISICPILNLICGFTWLFTPLDTYEEIIYSNIESKNLKK